MKKLSFVLIVLFVIGCGTQSGEKNEDTDSDQEQAETSEETQVVVEKPAVCIWDQVSVREEPSSKGKWTTSISLGETLTSLGIKALDSLDKNREYVKVRLADGTEGWSVSDFIIEDGRVGVFLEDKDLYKRPDLLTKTDNKFSQFDIVAIQSDQDDWYEITGKRAEGKWIESGWVKQGQISENSIDVAVAKFANAAMSAESDEEQIEGLEEILNNSDLSNSSFISVIEEKLADLTTPKEEIVEEMMEEDTIQ